MFLMSDFHSDSHTHLIPPPPQHTHNAILIITYNYHALINALSAYAIHINLNTIFNTHAEDSPTKTIYIRHHTHTHPHTHTTDIASVVRICFN